MAIIVEKNLKNSGIDRYTGDMDFIQKIVLDMVFTGTKRTNFRILKMLPTDVRMVMKEIGLKKVPANTHINQLESYSLLKRDRNTGKIYPTALTKILLNALDQIGSECIEPKVYEFINHLE